MRKIIQVAAAAMVVAGPCAQLQAAEFQPNFTIISDDITYTVNADATYTKDETETLRLNTEQSVKQGSQISLRYSTSLEDLEVRDAYTTTKDGKRIDVTPDKIMEQQSAESAGAPMFDDSKVKTVIFPAIEPGSTITLSEHRTRRKAMFPGQFSEIEYFRDHSDVRSAVVTVRAPASLKLYMDAPGMNGGQVTSDKPDTQVWRWTLENKPAHAPELDSVSANDHSPHVAVTTFPSFAAVGAAYQERAAPKAAVTPAVQAQADLLTKGITDRKEQAEALYNWVSTHVRYVAITLEFGGVVPHDADAILKAEYGDCKDHVTLLEALLAAKGIKSTPVLLNSGNQYSLPGVAAPLGVFDHVITYLPDFKLYVDSTAGLARFGTLPGPELGKSGLMMDDGSGNAKIVELPNGTPDSAQDRTTTRITLNSDGDVKGTSEVESTGSLDWISREVFASLAPGVEPQIASRLMSVTGQNGTGSYQHGDMHDLTKPLAYRTEFQVPGYVQLPGPGATPVPAGLGSLNDLAFTFEGLGPERRDFAMPFLNRHVTETTIITLADGMTVPNLPKPVKIVSPFGTYSATYVADGRTITVTRDLVISKQSILVQPDEYPELRKLALAVMRDLRTQLLYN
jgi:transglutaminase-like putative cysteine protease